VTAVTRAFRIGFATPSEEMALAQALRDMLRLTWRDAFRESL
jgi:hypothetical protein